MPLTESLRSAARKVWGEPVASATTLCEAAALDADDGAELLAALDPGGCRR